MFRSLKKSLWRVVPGSAQQAVTELAAERRRLRRDLRHLEREDRREFFRKAFFMLVFNEISGDYAEFGCWSGTTFVMAFQESRRAIAEIGSWGRAPKTRCRLWAFDSFSGLPAAADARDEHPRWVPGTLRTSLEEFHALLAKQGVPGDTYDVVPGYYEDTLIDPARQRSLPRDVALAFIDCDLYSSTRTVLRFLEPRLKQGMVIAFDDYYCYSPIAISGERRACLEAFPDESEWRLLPYVQFGWHGMSFVVERNEGPTGARGAR